MSNITDKLERIIRVTMQTCPTTQISIHIAKAIEAEMETGAQMDPRGFMKGFYINEKD
jgi:hypothetical protein